MDTAVVKIVDEILKDVSITQTQKNILIGLYSLNFYKSLFEILLIYKTKDGNFINEIGNFFNKSINSLPAEEKKDFDILLEQRKTTILAEVINTFKANVPEEIRIKIEANISAKNQSV